MLGPLLFLLYINDINSSSKDGLFVLFADDTNIFVSDKSRKRVFNKTRAILDKVNNYMRCNLLRINIKKWGRCNPKKPYPSLTFSRVGVGFFGFYWVFSVFFGFLKN